VRRARVACALAVAALILVLLAPIGRSARSPDLPSNVIIVVTDDQPADSVTGAPDGMPWLRGQLGEPASGWRWFPQTVVSTPMCCPSRATLLTGQPSWVTGVTDNETGWRMDEDATLGVWLRAAGYRTAMVGKYLNGYPWDRGPYVPPGWDRWLAKTNDAIDTTYYGYELIDQGVARRVGREPRDYVTDVLGQAALGFALGAPPDRPWFLYLAPPAPHAPYTPAPGDAGTLAGPVTPVPSDASLNDVRGKPAWLRARPPIDGGRAAELAATRLAQRETLLAVDRLLAELMRVVAARGETEDTIVIVTSDNGFSFGEHRWVGKQVPYEASIQVPLAVYDPGATTGADPRLASNLDVVPTILAAAGVVPPAPLLGHDLRAPAVPGAAVPIAWAGSEDVPAWRGVRSHEAVYIRWSTGEEELYDLARDPGQLVNLAAARPRGPGGPPAGPG